MKLWFVLRNFGTDGLREKIRNHISWARELADKVDRHPNFELIAPAPLSTVCFRYTPGGIDSDALNQNLLNAINDSGSLYLTHTRVYERLVIRLVVGQTYQLKEDIDKAWEAILHFADSVSERS